MSLTSTIELMGNKNSKSKQVPEDKKKEQENVEVATTPPTTPPPSESNKEEGEQTHANVDVIPSHVMDSGGHVRGKKGSIDTASFDAKRLREMDRNPSTMSVPTMNIAHEPITVKFKDIEGSLKTGDLALLYRHGQTEPHFAIFVNHSECDEHFPLLFIKGKTKPLELQHFKRDEREVRIITAVTRIFYGDYERVAIRKLKTTRKIECSLALNKAEEVEQVPYTQQELMFITEASSPELRSRYMCTFILSHVYHKLGIMLSNPCDITPEHFLDALPLEEPIFVKLPPVKPGPLITGEPPLLAQIAYVQNSKQLVVIRTIIHYLDANIVPSIAKECVHLLKKRQHPTLN